MKPTVSIIVALDSQNGIAKNGQIPWHISEDLKFFKATTMGHPIIMGRITYQTISKSLPGRTNIIITKNQNLQAKDCQVTHSLDEALKLAFKINSQEVFIIGGGQIYKQALEKDLVDQLYITRIKADFNCNIFFPDYSHFNKTISEKESHDSNYHFTFLKLEKKSLKPNTTS